MRKFEAVPGKEEKYTSPKRSTVGSAGYDLVSPETVHIGPRGGTATIKTGVRAIIPEDEVLLVYNRSSLPVKHGLSLVNAVGVIDSDYYNNPDTLGEIMVTFRNEGFKVATINEGDRIAQCIFTKFYKTDDDNAVGVRTGGYGSTGK